MRTTFLAALAALALSWSAPRAPGLDLLPPDSPLGVSLRGMLDLEFYASQRPPPGLLFENDTAFFNPRMTLFADLHAGRHLAGFVQARFDRGFDPGAKPDGDARLDEYYLRWTPWDEPVVNLQAGKFATVFGAWVPRHLSWDNPFITAPAAYENVIGVGDVGAPPTVGAFLNRRNLPDNKPGWMPVIWGPSYASGASWFGRVGRADYAFEVKNAGLSSRPGSWQADETGFSAPTWTGRLGYRPSASWNLGASGSTGAYVVRDPQNVLPAGSDRGDFRQHVLGLDAAYARHHIELWSELILSRFEVPAVGHADTLAYFVEAKYKITESLFAALRWNQQFFSSVGAPAGGETVWDRDLSRVDAALGWRFNRWLQAKVQYSYGTEPGPNRNGRNLLATVLTLRF